MVVLVILSRLDGHNVVATCMSGFLLLLIGLLEPELFYIGLVYRSLFPIVSQFLQKW